MFEHVFRRTTIVGIGMTLLLIPFLVSAESSSVTNVVSVTTSGGTSEASVRTVINGEVVEDTTTRSENGESITIESSHSVHSDQNQSSSSGATTSNVSITRSTTSTEEALQNTLERLLSLLTYYVSILSS